MDCSPMPEVTPRSTGKDSCDHPAIAVRTNNTHWISRRAVKARFPFGQIQEQPRLPTKLSRASEGVVQ
jgi:hypothetical protein